jgi:FG-GAP-like repeat
VDLDADGYPDILSGSYSRMEGSMAGLFQVLRGKPDGTFRKAEALKGTDGQPLIIPNPGKEEVSVENICTRPFAVDFDGDGQLDLVVGNFAGTFYWFKGEGKGKFRPKPELIKSAGGQPLRIQGYHSDPFVIDWDGDGALDIVSGSAEGGVQWAKNRAPKGKPPQFDNFEWLIKPGRRIDDGELVGEKDLTGPTTATRVWVADVNGDGKLDLLVGDNVRLSSPVKGVSVADCKKKYAVWRQAVVLASVKMSLLMPSQTKREKSANGDKAAKDEKRDKAKDDKAEQAKAERAKDREERLEKAREEYLKLYEQRNEFLKEEGTGFVWLYLQK